MFSCVGSKSKQYKINSIFCFWYCRYSPTFSSLGTNVQISGFCLKVHTIYLPSFEIQNYLEQINELTKIQTNDPKVYADKIFSKNIPSDVVESFVSRDGIAEVIQKYIENQEIDDLLLFSENNSLLEFNKDNKPKFTIIDLLPLRPVDKTFIEAIKKIENAIEFDYKNAEIVGNIYSISEKGTAMFQIESVNGQKTKVEKAQTTELTEDRRNICWQAGSGKKKLKIIGDISKKAGNTARIIIGDKFELLENKKY